MPQYKHNLIHFPPFERFTLTEISDWFDQQSAKGWNPVGTIEDLILMQKEKEIPDAVQTEVEDWTNERYTKDFIARIGNERSANRRFDVPNVNASNLGNKRRKDRRYARIRKLFGARTPNIR